MKAVTFRSKNEALKISELPVPKPSKGEVLVKIAYAAFNHLDLWIWKEDSLQNYVIPGADGSGVVYAIGDGVNKNWIGKEVLIDPGVHWGADENLHSEQYEIIGNPTNGTFAEFIRMPVENIHEKPCHLTLKEAAAIPLAALTAYRALFTKARLKSSDKVLITGAGGGAAIYLVQMAVAAGASVYVTSSSYEKINRAKQLGAIEGYNYREEDWTNKAKEQAGGFNVIVDSAGGNGFAQLTEVASPGARIVVFGRTAGNINNLKPSMIFNKQLQIMGTLMGTPNEFRSMLEFYEKHQLHPVIDKEFALEDFQQAASYMQTGNHFGKIILSVSKNAHPEIDTIKTKINLANGCSF
jgi:zinc-binding alcohol dehydrogenase/oxidoreductase